MGRKSITEEAGDGTEEEAVADSARSLSEEAESGSTLDPEDVDEYTEQDLDRFSTDKDNRTTWRYSDRMDARLQLAGQQLGIDSRQATMDFLLNQALREHGIE